MFRIDRAFCHLVKKKQRGLSSVLYWTWISAWNNGNVGNVLKIHQAFRNVLTDEKNGVHLKSIEQAKKKIRMGHRINGQTANGNNGVQTQMDSGHLQTHSVSLQSAERSEALCRYKWQKHHGTWHWPSNLALSSQIRAAETTSLFFVK